MALSGLLRNIHGLFIGNDDLLHEYVGALDDLRVVGTDGDANQVVVLVLVDDRDPPHTGGHAGIQFSIRHCTLLLRLRLLCKLSHVLPFLDFFILHRLIFELRDVGRHSVRSI